MYCSKCGTEILEGSKFCPKCGQPVNEPVFQYDRVEYRKEDIIKIAKCQTLLIFGVVLSMVLMPTVNVATALASEAIVFFACLLLIIDCIFYITVFCILRAAQKGNIVVTVIYIIGLLIPYISLIFLLVVNAKATAILRAAGLPVGLLGVHKPDLDEFKNKWG